MGLDQWREFDSWPPESGTAYSLYLHSSGQANTRGGDGQLSTQEPDSEPADNYRYQPRDPVPTCGGATLMTGMSVGSDCGPLDQRQVQARADVLCYTSLPLRSPMPVVGEVVLELYASTSGLDTDFTGKLVDVWPDGRAEILCDGIIRARLRDSPQQFSPVVPGKVYRYQLTLGATANFFHSEHRIRLEVSSSNFPRFAPNHNTGASFAESTEQIAVLNTVLHERNYPSRLILPLLPEGASCEHTRD